MPGSMFQGASNPLARERRFERKLELLAILLSALFMTKVVAAADANLALASSLRLVWPALLAEFRIADGLTEASFGVSFGSSGNLARQIQLGAPFALFVSANEQFVDPLVVNGLTESTGQIVVTGQLAWVALPGSIAAKTMGNAEKNFSVDVPATQTELLDLLDSKQLTSLAIANPAHAPYGMAALEVLQGQETKSQVKRLLQGENAAQALQFVAVGGAELGLLPASLVFDVLPGAQSAEKLAADNSVAAEAFVAVPADPSSYQPIRHRIVLLEGASQQVRSLYQFLVSERAKAIWSRHGFATP